MSTPPTIDYAAARRAADACLEQARLIMAAVNASTARPEPCQRGREAAQVVAALVAEWFKYPLADLKRKGREADRAWARQVAMYFMREFTTVSLVDAGRMFRRDHGCVVNAIKSVEARCYTEARTAADLANLRTHITLKLK